MRYINKLALPYMYVVAHQQEADGGTHGRRRWGHWIFPWETAGSPNPWNRASTLQPQSWCRGCSPRWSAGHYLDDRTERVQPHPCPPEAVGRVTFRWPSHLSRRSSWCRWPPPVILKPGICLGAEDLLGTVCVSVCSLCCSVSMALLSVSHRSLFLDNFQSDFRMHHSTVLINIYLFIHLY